jgi:hypothetical protein
MSPAVQKLREAIHESEQFRLSCLHKLTPKLEARQRDIQARLECRFEALTREMDSK